MRVLVVFMVASGMFLWNPCAFAFAFIGFSTAPAGAASVFSIDFSG